MGFASTNKSLEFRRKYFILLILILAVLSYGCDPLYNDYPHNKSNEWICANPLITLSYNKDENGALSQDEILIWEELSMVIDLAFRSDYFTMYPANTISHDDRLLSGSWYYRNGNLILTIEEDFIFDYQFDELVFVPQNIK